MLATTTVINTINQRGTFVARPRPRGPIEGPAVGKFDGFAEIDVDTVAWLRDVSLFEMGQTPFRIGS